MKKLEEMSFEEAYCELEAAVERLEAGELNLEEAIKLYEWGIHLARHCNAALDAAELQVEELLVLASPPG